MWEYIRNRVIICGKKCLPQTDKGGELSFERKAKTPYF
jgi:hypothetical protein